LGTFFIFYNNILKHFRFLLILCFVLHLYTISIARAECFSFIPYAHNNKYTHLPQNKNFCVKNKTGTFKFKTSQIHSRMIFKNYDDENSFFAFGDSQLLGIDWDDTKEVKHDLEKIMETKNISIFASPNNGPFQSLSQAKDIFKNKKFNNVKKIIFSFNFGNDIFRIQKKWKLENFVPLKTEDLNIIMDKPFLYDLVILKGVLSGKFFSTNLPDNLETYSLYKNLSKLSSQERINILLTKIEQFKSSLNKKINLIIYPPYWMYNKNGNVIYEDVYADFLNLLLYIKKRNIFYQVFIGKLNSKNYLTTDKRHFKTGTIKFEKQ